MVDRQTVASRRESWAKERERERVWDEEEHSGNE